MKKSTILRTLVLAALVTAMAVLLIRLPVRQYITDFLGWVRGLGVWGPVILAAAYIPACVLCIPGSVMTLAAGFAFGVVRGTLAVSIGSTLGVSAAFWVGRTLARSWVEGLAARNPKFAALDRAVAEHGFKIVLLTRLSPVFPFNVLNYAYGLTRVHFRDYLPASWIGMLPGTILYVYVGSGAQSLTELTSGQMEGGAATKVYFFSGLAVAVVVTVLITRIAKKALAAALPSDPSAQPGSPTTM